MAWDGEALPLMGSCSGLQFEVGESTLSGGSVVVTTQLSQVLRAEMMLIETPTAQTQTTYTAPVGLDDPPTKAQAEAEFAKIKADLDEIKVDVASTLYPSVDVSTDGQVTFTAGCGDKKFRYLLIGLP